MIKGIINKTFGGLNEWIFQTAFLGCILVFVAAISYINVFMWGAITYAHTIGVLIDFLIGISISLNGSMIICNRKGFEDVEKQK